MRWDGVKLVRGEVGWVKLVRGKVERDEVGWGEVGEG